MRTLIGMAAVAIPMWMAAMGDFSSGLLTIASVAAIGCWAMSGWFVE